MPNPGQPYQFLQNTGVTPRETEFFQQGLYPITYPGGSPAGSTQQPGVYGGPRFSPFFGPSGLPYDQLSSGDRAYHRIVDAINLQRGFTDTSYANVRDLIGAQAGSIGRGFDEAQNYVGQFGQNARRQALEREDQLAAQYQGQTGGRSYAYDYARRGLSADTTRALSAIDEQIGQLYSGLALQRAGQESGIYGNLATTYLQQLDTYQQLLAQQFSLLGGYAPESSGGRDYSGLYNLAGSLAQAGSYYAANKGGGNNNSGGGN